MALAWLGIRNSWKYEKSNVVMHLIWIISGWFRLIKSSKLLSLVSYPYWTFLRCTCCNLWTNVTPTPYILSFTHTHTHTQTSLVLFPDFPQNYYNSLNIHTIVALTIYNPLKIDARIWPLLGNIQTKRFEYREIVM